MNMDYLKYASYVHSSMYRERIMNYLSEKEYATPTTISEATGLHISHISKVLKVLSGRGFVECLNDDARKGRLYHLTELGQCVVEHLEFLKE